MTLEEAIEILESKYRFYRAELGENGLQAIKLGIEALERCAEARKKAYFTSRGLLPSETKE